MGRQRRGGGRGGGGGGQPKAVSAGRGVQKPSARGGRKGGKEKPKTAEQLDADLAAYVISKEAAAAAVQPAQPQAQRVTKKEPPVMPDKEALDADLEAYRLSGLAVKEASGDGAQ